MSVENIQGVVTAIQPAWLDNPQPSTIPVAIPETPKPIQTPKVESPSCLPPHIGRQVDIKA